MFTFLCLLFLFSISYFYYLLSFSGFIYLHVRSYILYLGYIFIRYKVLVIFNFKLKMHQSLIKINLEETRILLVVELYS